LVSRPRLPHHWPKPRRRPRPRSRRLPLGLVHWPLPPRRSIHLAPRWPTPLRHDRLRRRRRIFPPPLRRLPRLGRTISRRHPRPTDRYAAPLRHVLRSPSLAGRRRKLLHTGPPKKIRHAPSKSRLHLRQLPAPTTPPPLSSWQRSPLPPNIRLHPSQYSRSHPPLHPRPPRLPAFLILSGNYPLRPWREFSRIHTFTH